MEKSNSEMAEERPLSDRVAALEAAVRNLQQSVEQIRSAIFSTSQKAPAQAPAIPSAEKVVYQKPPQTSRPTASPGKKAFVLPEHMRKSEFWLNKVGIGLLLFAVIFLFKYSIDQGWLTPTIRILFGLGLGTTLLILGYRLYSRKKHFSQVLTGGAIATYYITGFAAFQMFALVSHPVAFAFMVAVTILSFLISLKQDEAIFSLIGTLGGLGTPFLLYTESGSVPGLMLYTCLILAGTGAVYMYRGWCSLLWLSILAGWSVFIVGMADGVLTASQIILSNQWAVQASVLFGWLIFWGVPIIREVASSGNPVRWVPASIASGRENPSRAEKFILDYHVLLLTVVVPIVTLGLSTPLWEKLSQETWGWIILAGAMVYGLVYMALMARKAFQALAFTHVVMALVMFTGAVSLLLKGSTLLIFLTAEGVALHLIAHRTTVRGISVFAHFLYAIIGLWLIVRLLHPEEGVTAMLNGYALVNLLVIVSAVGLYKVLRTGREIYAYRLISHILLLGWFLSELTRSENGQGYVTIAWGIYSAALLVLGLIKDYRRARNLALITLFVVVGKLFLVDLANLEVLWRILLFMGFGGLFLFLSYYFQDLWKAKAGLPDEDPAA
jgi:uncharacterized membrane protein